MRGMNVFWEQGKKLLRGALNKDGRPLPLAPTRLAHLSFDTPERLLQQQREAPHLPLEPIVVIGEGPQGRLQS